MRISYFVVAALALATATARAQVTPAPPSPAAPAADSLDFAEFGDADGKEARTFATQKVLYLGPTKLISLGYEAQTGFDLTTTGQTFDPPLTQEVDKFRGLRLGVNAPVISRSNFILNLGLTYWNTSVGVPAAPGLWKALGRGLRSTGVNATVFKPFDNKHFLLLQASADLNGNYRSFDDVSSQALTYSGTAIYGWKPNDNYMWGLGLTRTYRAGQLLHIPVVFYNRTFSPRWGVEAVFPARANLRRSFGTSSLLMLGYEIEGNAYYLGPVDGQDIFLRRGELKPRITYERQLAGFVWLSAQVGYRYNWRFDGFTTQNPTGDDKPVYENTPGNPLYFNVSVNLVSP